MPFVASRGQRIHYFVEGAGPLVILQHGLLSNAAGWKERGVVDALAGDFQVACVDSLGHGASDKPADPALYRQASRAADIVAVMDELQAERAHLAGYSMGGWIAVGVAKHFPSRLASLAVGGWDVIHGVETARPPSLARPLSFDDLLAGVRRGAPRLVEWVTPDVEPGLRACWDACGELEGASQALLGVGCPVMLWNGRDDPYHDPMKAFAHSRGLRFLSIPGDHLNAMLLHGSEAAAGLRAFIEAGQAAAR